MTTKNLHFKWTTSKGQNTYGYNICTLIVDGKNKGRCMGGGYDMQGTSFAQWLQAEFQEQLQRLFAPEIEIIKTTEAKEGGPVRSYNTSKGKKVKYSSAGDRFYGATITVYEDGEVNIGLDGGCGFSSMERIANAIGIGLKWNPESDRYRNHTYYTAFIELK